MHRYKCMYIKAMIFQATCLFLFTFFFIFTYLFVYIRLFLTNLIKYLF